MDQAQVMKRERGLDKVIPQNVERNQSNDQRSKDVKGYEENSRGDKYNSHRDGGDNSDGQCQQLNHERHKHHTNSRRSSVFGSKRYG